MSLSEVPQVKITFSTAQEICDDIWAGAIQYAKAVGFSLNPFVTTSLWAGLLLSARKDLDANGIFLDVQQKFIPSFSNIYNVGLDQVELLADLKNRMQTLLASLSEELGDLDSERKIFDFVNIAVDVNEQFAEGSEVSLVKGVQLFQKTASLLSSHIYCILHGTDSGMILQFADAKNTLSLPVERQPAPQPPKPQTADHSPTPVSNHENQSTLYRFAGFIAVILIILAAVIVVAGFSGWQEAPPPKETTQTPQLPQKPRPQSGDLLLGSFSEESELTITTTATEDCVVTLKNANGVTKLAFYVRAGDTVTVGVPSGNFYVYFASGKEWYGYGQGRMFGKYTSYSKDDEILDFVNYTWEYTLYPVTDGNFSETPIDEGEFFN